MHEGGHHMKTFYDQFLQYDFEVRIHNHMIMYVHDR